MELRRNLRRRALVFAALLSLGAAARATAAEAVIERLSVAIAPNPAARTFAGSELAVVRAPEGGANEVRFDVAGLNVSRAFGGSGETLARETNGGALTVRLARTYEPGSVFAVRLEFSGGENAGLDFPASSDSAWSRGEDEGGRWFPAPADPSARVVADVTATVPEGLAAISNGRLESRVPGPRPGTVRFHWIQERAAPAALMALYVGRYVAVETGAVTDWVPPGREDDARAAFGKTPEMMAFFSELFGAPYPWAEYSQTTVDSPLEDGLENAAAARFDASVLRPARERLGDDEELVAHELVHQWFGAWVSRRDLSDSRLNEGFATYFAAVWLGHERGADAFSWSLDEKARACFAEPPGAALPLGSVARPDACVYARGAWVLQSLRAELGDAVFADAVRRYARGNAGRAAGADDFRRAAEAASGKNLAGFFDRWARGAGWPKLALTLSYDSAAKKLQLSAVQRLAAGSPPFHVRLPLSLDDGTVLAAELGRERQVFSWPVASRPRWAAVDSGQTLLADVARSWPEDMLRGELAGGPTAASRARAARDLGDAGSPRAIAALRACLHGDAFWGVAAECAASLGRGAGEAALAALAAGAAARDPRVRDAVAKALGDFAGRGAAAEAALKALARDENRVVAADGAAALERRSRP